MFRKCCNYTRLLSHYIRITNDLDTKEHSKFEFAFADIPPSVRKIRFSEKLFKRFSGQGGLYLLALATGLAAGCMAGLLKLMIDHLSRFATSFSTNIRLDWTFLILPTIGLLLTALFVKGIFGTRINHGVKRVIGAIKANKFYLNAKLLFGPMLASTLTLGFGGSAGSEGPIATTGAAIGSNLGRSLGLSPDIIRILIGCGAAAGIAGIFKSPIGGVLFTIEILKIPLNTMIVLAIIVASIAATFTASLIGGFTPDIPFSFTGSISLDDYWWIILLGLFCGLYSFYYSWIMSKFGNRIDRQPNATRRILIAGGTLAVILFLFPSMYGEGYGVLGRIINGNINNVAASGVFGLTGAGEYTLLLTFGCIMLLKCFATASATCGGVAGDFAPALFAGGICGVFFGLATNMLLGTEINVGLCGYLGMAGVMAGVIRAPLMACFLVMEMAGAYLLVVPIALVCGLSFVMMRSFTSSSYFKHNSLRPDGFLFKALSEQKKDDN